MTSIFHPRLLKDFASLLNDTDDFNVIIQVGENDNIKEFRSHSAILRARSAYFKSALSNEWVTKKDGIIHYNKPNITPIVFDIVLKYIYTGELVLKNHLDKDVFELLIASDELLLEELFEPVQKYLIKNHTTWIQENFDLVFHTVFELSVCKILQDFCLNIICAKPQLLFTSKNFLSLDKDILYRLLERDYLQINEIDAWDCLIKWGIEQTPGLGSMNSDSTKWNNEDYDALKKTLDQFIPLIRFVDFSPTEYFNKIQPYKAIIPNDIYEEIEEFYIKSTLPKSITLPPRDRIESNIIKPYLISKIINWIDKKNVDFIRDNNDSLYKFDLIYQGSQDGISNKSFKNKCNLQEPILVLIKCQNSQKIFGGYTPVGFYHFMEDVEDIDEFDRYIFSTDSFVFHIEEDENMKLSRVRESCFEFAVYNNFYDEFDNFYGFNFGEDLCMFNNELCVGYGDFICAYDLSYPCTFMIEDVEAFKVVKQ